MQRVLDSWRTMMASRQPVLQTCWRLLMLSQRTAATVPGPLP